MTLGITGISGSGKHMVANFFKEKEWVILDADKIAHDLYRPYTGVWKKITKEFGEKILNTDDTINRFKLSEIVFNPSDPDASKLLLGKLNQIIHPYMKRRMKEVIHRHFHRESNIVVIAALWEELELKKLCDKILLIKANPETRLKRIQNRDGISAEMYKMRIKNQKDISDPDYTIENNGELRELKGELNGITL